MSVPAPLVLLSGLQSDRRSWTKQLDHFEGRRPVVVPEGHQFETSIAAMAGVVERQLPERFHLAAWSMGGYVALELVPRLAGRVLSLVLIATSARPENEGNTQRRLSLVEAVESGGMREAAFSSIAFSADLENVDPDVVEAVIQSWIDLGPAAYRGQQQAIIARAPTFDNLALIDAPTLIMAGTDDAVVPPECACELHDGIAGSEILMIPGCGHCPPFERPDLVNATLETWLAKVEDGRGP